MMGELRKEKRRKLIGKEGKAFVVVDFIRAG